ncbi:peptidase, M42 (glutamyl aminopeptidase) family [Streptococcus pneumoniae]|nr:peptidase, M42 (glutamyl aminopeptidase) family [Streptococcus pneumoniae]
MNQTVEYIKELTAIASPTGFTREISNYLVKTLEGFGYQPVRTAKGGVNVTIKGQNDEQHRYVTAHVDTLGAIVRAVKPDGRLKLDRIGGFPWNMIEGENCTVHVASQVKRYQEPSSSTKLLAMSTRMQELQNARRTIWKCVWM